MAKDARFLPPAQILNIDQTVRLVGGAGGAF
jgi:hypothetical protein